MKPLLLGLILAGCAHAGFANLMVQSSFGTRESEWVYSVGGFRQSKSPHFYYEGGFVFQPAFGSSAALVLDGVKEEREYTHSFYGLYGGTHYNLWPILRPGVLFGTTLRKSVIFQSQDGTNFYFRRETDFAISPYFGLSAHVGICSLVLTNHGLGGGLNFPF